VDVQIVLVRSAGHAESKRDPQPEERIFSIFSLLVEKIKVGDLCHPYACCQRNIFIYFGTSISQYHSYIVHIIEKPLRVNTLQLTPVIVKYLTNNLCLLWWWWWCYQKRILPHKIKFCFYCEVHL